MVCYVLFNNQWLHSWNKPKQSNFIHLKFLNPPIIIIFYHDESKKTKDQSRFHLVTKVRTYKQINKRQMVIMQHKNNNEMWGSLYYLKYDDFQSPRKERRLVYEEQIVASQ
jgi:hypothetical protein